MHHHDLDQVARHKPSRAGLLADAEPKVLGAHSHILPAVFMARLLTQLQEAVSNKAVGVWTPYCGIGHVEYRHADDGPFWKMRTVREGGRLLHPTVDEDWIC